jgi:hypothetical protein
MIAIASNEMLIRPFGVPACLSYSPSSELTHIQNYYNDIRQKYATGMSTEMTFRTPFENLIGDLATDLKLIQEPQRKGNIGAPDFKVYRGGAKIGYIETKDLDVDLDREIDSDQIKKYRASADNILLTNYHRFLLIRDGVLIEDFELFAETDLEKLRFFLTEEKATIFTRLLLNFSGFSKRTVCSAEQLASELSKRTRLLKELSKEQLDEDLINSKAGLPVFSTYDFYEGVRELIPDINSDDCSDAYAQTITYGLFLAKATHPSLILDRTNASSGIPKSIGLIRRIFLNISGDLIPSNLSWIVDEIIEVLNSTDIVSVLNEITDRTNAVKDAFILFYEDFLSQYDSAKRKKMGVYYTPRPIVSFIVGSVNFVLKQLFSKNMGLANDGVKVLDPAVGTGTFLSLVYLGALLELKNNRQSGMIEDKIRKHLLKDFYGFEIQITPYILSHLKLSLVVQSWFYKLSGNDRIQIYLTNTLEKSMHHDLVSFMREISEENVTANEVKAKENLLAVIGNPPYRGLSVNKSKWIQDLLHKGYTRPDGTVDQGYYVLDGKPLGEKNPKWLQDDYVKFIRFAQWKIDQSGEGVVGYITNNAYLDNPTFRGMRQSLLKSFNRIYIVNLHGNSRLHEKSPDGGIDENVFEIKPGVAIVIFVRHAGISKQEILYYDLYGTREQKFKFLDGARLKTLNWQMLLPTSPNYFLRPEGAETGLAIRDTWKINDIFKVGSVGIVTARDSLTIRWTADEVKQTVVKFMSMDPEQARVSYQLGKDVRDWRVVDAQEDLKKEGLRGDLVIPILYRPFDVRYTYYTGKSRGFLCMPRPKVMRNMLRSNISLCIGRAGHAVGSDKPWNLAFCSTVVEDFNLFYRGGNVNFPLYLYEEKVKGKNGKTNDLRETNISPALTEQLEKYYGFRPNPEDIFAYIYSILYSGRYREKFADALNIDFPRIPFTHDSEQFLMLARLGNELLDLHVGKEKPTGNTSFEVSGTNLVKFCEYRNENVFINETQFFGNISFDVWDFQIGGYQVLNKWLKDRKSRRLSNEELVMFPQIVEVLNRTIKIMAKIDETGFLDRM